MPHSRFRVCKQGLLYSHSDNFHSVEGTMAAKEGKQSFFLVKEPGMQMWGEEKKKERNTENSYPMLPFFSCNQQSLLSHTRKERALATAHPSIRPTSQQATSRIQVHTSLERRKATAAMSLLVPFKHKTVSPFSSSSSFSASAAATSGLTQQYYFCLATANKSRVVLYTSISRSRLCRCVRCC